MENAIQPYHLDEKVNDDCFVQTFWRSSDRGIPVGDPPILRIIKPASFPLATVFSECNELTTKINHFGHEHQYEYEYEYECGD